MKIECTQCHFMNPDDAEFCENCGAQLPLAGAIPAVAATPAPVAPVAASDNLVCPNCKAPFVVGDVFCFNCGYDLTKVPAVPAPVQPQVAPVLQQPPTERANAAAQPAPAVATPPKEADISPDDFDKLLATGAPVPAPVPVQAAPPVAEPIPPAQPTPTPVQSAPAGDYKNLVLSITGPYGLETVEYVGRELLLGRKDVKTRIFPDVNLDDAASSRRHLSMWLEVDEGHFYAQDLESSNGTLLNNQDMPPGEPVQLKDGDIIKIGTRYSIQVRLS
jgi:hypothetical protein